jgi:transposase InsO family protein
LRDKYPVRLLCGTLGCSKSGYYDWIKLGRPKHKAFDKVINDLVLETYNNDTRWGIIQIRMNIKAAYGLCLTNATVYRYMRLNDIQSICRRKTRKYPKPSDHEIPNLLQRNFNTNRPNKKWSIDISYIFCRDGIYYLCAIKDMYDKSIISWRVSPYIDFKLVMDTLNDSIQKIPYNQRQELILHSDQGWHFTHPVYQQTLIDNGISQSISRKGSSVDNAPIESFFAIIKTECIYLEDHLTTKNLELIVSDYIYYYNNNRLQEKLKELPPIVYREQALQSLFY